MYVAISLSNSVVAVINTTTRAVEQTKGMRVIYVCVVTTSVLERTFIFSLYIRTDNGIILYLHAVNIGF